MIVTSIVLGALGLCFGSFIHAVAWRIHAGRDFVKERSECDTCHHTLGPLDLVPVFSWLFLGGKCRYCRKPISWHHPVAELVTGALFVLSYIYWPLQLDTWHAWFGFICWLIYIVGLVGLFIYDLRWMMLPDKIIFPLIGVAIVDVAVRLYMTPHMTIYTGAEHIVLGVASVGGVYALLYYLSKGAWVGFGDVKFGIFMGLVLGWQMGLVALILANVLGLLVVAPGLLTKRLNRKSKVPFGPFLIAGFILAGLFGQTLVNWYIDFLLFPGI